jgi:hypothetical protein
MNRTVSARQIRLVVLVGLLVVIAGGWFLVIEPRNNSTTTTPAAPPPAHTVPAATTPATHPAVPTTPAPSHPARAHTARPPAAPAHEAPGRSATRPHAVTTQPHGVTRSHAAPTAIRPTRVGYGFPPAVRKAFAKTPVVVVSLYTPGVALDKLTRAEAEAGAKATGAGFVALDVLAQREVGPFLTMLGPLEAPAVLVVRRCCGWAFAMFQGFVDRDSVEQAVVDARR